MSSDIRVLATMTITVAHGTNSDLRDSLVVSGGVGGERVFYAGVLLPLELYDESDE